MVTPSKHAEKGLLREVWREFNRLRDYVVSLRPQPGQNVHIKHTSQGVTLSANPKSQSGGTTAGPARWA